MRKQKKKHEKPWKNKLKKIRLSNYICIQTELRKLENFLIRIVSVVMERGSRERKFKKAHHIFKIFDERKKAGKEVTWGKFSLTGNFLNNVM